MSLARTRIVVAVFGLAVLAAITAGLALVGGPGSGRLERRDADPATPATLAEVSAACLSPDAASRLVDPETGAPYRIGFPSPDGATVCADFETPAPRRGAGWPSFDAATGCVSIGLAAP